MFSWKAAVVWVGALVATTVLTWQIVNAADSRVGEVPVAVAPTLASSTTSSPTTTTPTTSTAVSPTTRPSSPTTTTPSATTTSSSGATTSTSTPDSAAAWSVRTITSPGGAVVVRYRPGEVELQAATPAPGFSVEIDDAGPPRVRVEFEGEDDVSVEVEWDDGQLDVEIDD